VPARPGGIAYADLMATIAGAPLADRDIGKAPNSSGETGAKTRRVFSSSIKLIVNKQCLKQRNFGGRRSYAGAPPVFLPKAQIRRTAYSSNSPRSLNTKQRHWIIQGRAAIRSNKRPAFLWPPRSCVRACYEAVFDCRMRWTSDVAISNLGDGGRLETCFARRSDEDCLAFGDPHSLISWYGGHCRERARSSQPQREKIQSGAQSVNDGFSAVGITATRAIRSCWVRRSGSRSCPPT
jgi:hypothetical protein